MGVMVPYWWEFGLLNICKYTGTSAPLSRLTKKHSGSILSRVSEFISEQAISLSVFTMGTCYIPLDNRANMREVKRTNKEQWTRRNREHFERSVDEQKLGGAGIMSRHAELGFWRGAKHLAPIRTLKEPEHPCIVKRGTVSSHVISFYFWRKSKRQIDVLYLFIFLVYHWRQFSKRWPKLAHS